LSSGTTLSPTQDLNAILAHHTEGSNRTNVDGDEREERLEDYTVVYGAQSERRKWDGKSRVAEENLRNKHLEYLREILPK
jgi:hypothetical protein